MDDSSFGAKLADGLRNLDAASFEWKLGMYSTHKGKDGQELSWHICEMDGIEEQVESTKDFLLKKPVADKAVAAYSPFLSYKENIFLLEQNDEMVHELLADIKLGLRNGALFAPLDFASGRLPKMAGSAFYGRAQDGSEVVFMRCQNPLLSGARLFIGTENGLAEGKFPVFKFASSADMVAFDGDCYLFSQSIESALAFESRYLKIAKPHLGKLADAGIISNYDSFEMTALKLKNAKKFVTFDVEILEHVCSLPIVERMEYLEKFAIELDKDGKMNSYEPLQCELIVDLFCSRSCLDPLNRLSVGAIAPRE